MGKVSGFGRGRHSCQMPTRRAYLGWAYKRVCTGDPLRVMTPHQGLVHFSVDLYAAKALLLLSRCPNVARDCQCTQLERRSAQEKKDRLHPIGGMRLSSQQPEKWPKGSL